MGRDDQVIQIHLLVGWDINSIGVYDPIIITPSLLFFTRLDTRSGSSK